MHVQETAVHIMSDCSALEDERRQLNKSVETLLGNKYEEFVNLSFKDQFLMITGNLQLVSSSRGTPYLFCRTELLHSSHYIFNILA